MTDENRFLGLAKLKNEGEPVGFDEVVVYSGRQPRGAGQTMRDLPVHQQAWYVVRDRFCSYDIDDEEAAVWTLSRSPDETGWETDGGFGGYGLTYADARALADAANRGP
jgi:hypothetical protein